MDNLKTKLLNTGYFLDNDYLNNYIDLVKNHTVGKSAFRSQSHHIIPKTYFRTLKLPIDNSDDNFAELLYKDHVKAHLLLQKCTTGFLCRNNGCALRYLASTAKKYDCALTEQDLDELQQMYEESILQVNKEQFIKFYSEHTCRETATHFDIGANTVTRLATEYGCRKQPKNHLAKLRTEISREALEQYYIVENHTIVETALYFDVNKSTIIRRLQDCGLAQQKNAYRHAKRSSYVRELDDPEEFKAFYKEHSLVDTAIYFNMSEDTVRKFVDKYALHKQKNFDYEAILAYYAVHGATKTIEQFNISRTHLYRIKRKYSDIV